MTETPAAPTPPAASTPQTRASVPFAGQLLLIFLIAALASAIVQLSPGVFTDEQGSQFMLRRNLGLIKGDGCYHLRMAYMYRTGEMFAAGHDYHWMRGSTWEHGFSDKDFLYHVYLIPFTVFAKHKYDYDGFIVGGQVSIVVLCGLAAVALAAAMRLLGVRRIWFFVLLAACCGGAPFLFRINEARAWIMSLGFAMLGWALMARRLNLWLFVVAVIYTLAYTASHLLLLLCVFRTLCQLALGPGRDGAASRKAEFILNLKQLGVIAGGIAVGALLHPQPLELLRVWWIQNVMVLNASSFGNFSGPTAFISRLVMGYGPGQSPPAVVQSLMGDELAALPARDSLLLFPLVLGIPIVLPVLAACLRWRPSREALIMLAASCVFAAATLWSLRFIEYAGPFAAATAGVWLTGLAAARPVGRLLGRWGRQAKLAFIALVVVASAYALNNTRLVTEKMVPNLLPYEDLAMWMQAHHEEVSGKVVYNHNWDQFMYMFFYYPDADYICGLDPVYAAARADDKAHFYIRLMAGDMVAVGGHPQEKTQAEKEEGERNVLRNIRELFGAEYVLVSAGPNPNAYLYFRRMAREGRLKIELDVLGRDGVTYMFFRIPPLD